MAKKYRVRPFMNSAYFTAIGRAVVTWAFLEIQIDKLLIPLLWHKKATHLRKKTRINPGELLPNSFKARMAIWPKLARIHYSGETLDTALALIIACKSANTRRDRLVHAEWVIAYSAKYRGELVSYHNRHGRRYADEPVSLADIRKLNHDIGDAIVGVRNLTYQHHPDGPLHERLLRWFQAHAQDSKTPARFPTPNKPPLPPRPSREVTVACFDFSGRFSHIMLCYRDNSQISLQRQI